MTTSVARAPLTFASNLPVTLTMSVNGAYTQHDGAGHCDGSHTTGGRRIDR